MRTLLIVFITVFLAFGFAFKKNEQVKPSKLLLGMFDSIKGIHTLRTKIAALERLDQKFVTAESEIKLQTTPRKLYFLNPNKKLEILYNSELSQKATVKPHVFPYLTVNLDPTGNLMRKNQHYTINELGFDFIGKSIALTIKKDNDALNHFVYHGKVQKNGYTCYLLEYENKNYGYQPYTVGEKETCSSIAYKLCVNDYLLRNKNNLMNDFGYLKKGSTLQVPNLFCKKAIIYMDERLMLPVSISLSDDNGLFESYSFTGIVINKPFHADEFSVNYKDYRF